MGFDIINKCWLNYIIVYSSKLIDNTGDGSIPDSHQKNRNRESAAECRFRRNENCVFCHRVNCPDCNLYTLHRQSLRGTLLPVAFDAQRQEPTVILDWLQRAGNRKDIAEKCRRSVVGCLANNNTQLEPSIPEQ